MSIKWGKIAISFCKNFFSCIIYFQNKIVIFNQLFFNIISYFLRQSNGVPPRNFFIVSLTHMYSSTI